MYMKTDCMLYIKKRITNNILIKNIHPFLPPCPLRSALVRLRELRLRELFRCDRYVRCERRESFFRRERYVPLCPPEFVKKRPDAMRPARFILLFFDPGCTAYFIPRISSSLLAAVIVGCFKTIIRSFKAVRVITMNI